MSSGFEGVLDSSVLRFAEALSGGRGALDAWLEVNNEADVRLHVEAYAEKRSRQLAEQRAELLEALGGLYDELERDHYGAGYAPEPDEPMGVAKTAIANATQQRKEPGA